MSGLESLLAPFRAHDNSLKGYIAREDLLVVLQKLDGSWTQEKQDHLLSAAGYNHSERVPYEGFLTWVYSGTDSRDTTGMPGGTHTVVTEESCEVEGPEKDAEEGTFCTGPSSKQEVDWVRLGGTELEEPLKHGWVKLVRADWLVQLADSGSALQRRQDLPAEAFVGLDELKAAGPGGIQAFDVNWEWLRVIVLSYPWLQPGHPDPHGENLRLVAKALRAFVQDSVFTHMDQGIAYTVPYVNEGKPYGVLIDFTGLFQMPRTEQEATEFKLALPALNRFYSHPNTVVLKVTQFPQGYPTDPAHPYVLPEGANTVAYAERGWCCAESAMSSLVKDSGKVLDLGRLPDTPALAGIIFESMSGREAPVSPAEFKEELDKKTFTSKRADFERVASLYAGAFAERIDKATELAYSGLEWSAGGVRRLLRALEHNCSLLSLNLSHNTIGAEGAAALAEALHSSCLQSLNVASNNLGAEGATALSQALTHNAALEVLNLALNNIGPNGAEALGQALQDNNTLRSLDLSSNGIGDRGMEALAEALRSNTSLQWLNLPANNIEYWGTRALAQALLCNCTLSSLSLAINTLGAKGAQALGEALEHNASLTALCLYLADIGPTGTRVLANGLRGNSALQQLDLGRNSIGLEGVEALGRSLSSNSSLSVLNLGDAIDVGGEETKNTIRSVLANPDFCCSFLRPRDNNIDGKGAKALGLGLQSNNTLSKLNISSQGASEEGLAFLRQVAAARAESGGPELVIDAD